MKLQLMYSFKGSPTPSMTRMLNVVPYHVKACFRSLTSAAVRWVCIRCFQAVCVSLIDRLLFRLYSGRETCLWKPPVSTVCQKIQSLRVWGDTARPLALRCRQRLTQLQINFCVTQFVFSTNSIYHCPQHCPKHAATFRLFACTQQ